MVDKKKLLEAIDKWQESLSPRTDIRDSIIFDTLESVNATIDDMEIVDVPDTNVGKWIPCSERLPKEADGVVLICSKYGKVDTGHYSEFSSQWYYGSMNAVGGINVIAWMPLPEPYKESEE